MHTEYEVQEVGPASEAVRKRRFTRYTAKQRAALLKAYDESGQKREAFCEARGINAGTFKGWLTRRKKAATAPSFAKVEIPVSSTVPVEIVLSNDVRVSIQHHGSPDELVAVIRGVAGCRQEERHKC